MTPAHTRNLTNFIPSSVIFVFLHAIATSSAPHFETIATIYVGVYSWNSLFELFQALLLCIHLKKQTCLCMHLSCTSAALTLGVPFCVRSIKFVSFISIYQNLKVTVEYFFGGTLLKSHCIMRSIAAVSSALRMTFKTS